MLKPVRTVAPADPVLTVAECKSHLRVTHSDDDTLIGLFRDAAITRLDARGNLGRCMVSQTWRQDYACWPEGGILRLPFPDVSAVTSLKYSDENDVEQTVSASLYALREDELGSGLWFKKDFTTPNFNTDRPDPIRCLFVAGFGTAADVPAAIKAGMLLMVGDLYENRESTAIGVGIDVRPLPLGVDALLGPYRRVGV